MSSSNLHVLVLVLALATSSFTGAPPFPAQRIPPRLNVQNPVPSRGPRLPRQRLFLPRKPRGGGERAPVPVNTCMWLCRVSCWEGTGEDRHDVTSSSRSGHPRLFGIQCSTEPMEKRPVIMSPSRPRVSASFILHLFSPHRGSPHQTRHKTPTNLKPKLHPQEHHHASNESDVPKTLRSQTTPEEKDTCRGRPVLAPPHPPPT